MNTTLMHFVGSLLSANFHFTVTSAKRTPEENEAAGGAPVRKSLRSIFRPGPTRAAGVYRSNAAMGF
jgi:hypothetical protein